VLIGYRQGSTRRHSEIQTVAAPGADFVTIEE
jgi:hypothetical protein